MQELILNVFIPMILSLLIAFKTSNISNDLPDIIHDIYDEPMYKLIIFIILFLIIKKNFLIGLLLFINVILVLMDYHILSEGFQGPNLNSDIYNKKSIDYTGTAFYPMSDNNKLKEGSNFPYAGEVDYNI